jgi:hypothetical protein
VVRPVARYRPGARRGGPQLEPVYFRTELFRSALGTTITFPHSLRSVQVYTGSQEQIADLLVSDLSPAPVVSDADPGFVNAAIDYVFEFFSSPSGNTLILGTQWYGTVQERTLRVFEHSVNDTLYCCLLRTTRFVGNYIVDFALELPGFPTLFNRVQKYGIPCSVNYDVVTIGVNLFSGEISVGSSTLYTSGLSNIEVRGLGGVNTYTRAGVYAGYKEAIVASLPSGHPFKTCGVAAWDFLDNLHAGNTGNYSYTTPTFYEGPFFSDSSSIVDGQNVASPDHFNRSRQSFAARARLDNMAGVNLTNGQRVLRNGSVHELSSLSPAWLSCQGYSLLGAVVPGSFAEYSPGNVADLADLLDVSGLSQDDQDGITAAATPPEPPLSIVASETVTGFDTSDPTYFVSNNYRPLVAGSDLIRFYSTHYLISD